MKDRPILISAIILTLVFELVLMYMVYNEVGEDRLPSQLVRLFVQLILIFLILTNKSSTALFLLAAYHIVSGLYGLYSEISTDLIGQVFIGFHLIIGLVIYFHDWIENKLGVKKAA